MLAKTSGQTSGRKTAHRDYFLVGVDVVKDGAILDPAYDDAMGPDPGTLNGGHDVDGLWFASGARGRRRESGGPELKRRVASYRSGADPTSEVGLTCHFGR